MLEFKGYSGILYCGDPHLWSKGPGRRLDKDSFSTTVLRKLEQTVDIAIAKNAYLIFLGDLFHDSSENDISMLTKLIRILRKLPEPCATLGGNHEKSKPKLSDDVALAMMEAAGVIRVIDDSGVWAKFDIDGFSEYVGATPYGQKIPNSVSVSGLDSKRHVTWLTHHDLDFGETYPGAVPIHEIKNADMLVNGHIHKTKKSIRKGGMIAHNPGNITRLSIDCKDHIPSVWLWTPEDPNEIEPLPLSYEKDAFDLTGKQIEVEDSEQMVSDSLTVQQTSVFVEKMRERSKELDPSQTDDGAYIKSNIVALAKAMCLDASFTDEMLAIADDSLTDKNGSTA